MGQVLRFVPAAGVWNEHASILEAMAEGDAEIAAELMRRHLVDAQDRVRTIAGASPS
jgi:DNA-binding GntR family transcriptional regulator